MFRSVLIDIDNTLLDFPECAALAMRRGLEEMGLEYKDGYADVFTAVNNTLWADIEQKKMTRETLRHVRFEKIFERLGIALDGFGFELRFEKLLGEGTVEINGARELLEYLYPKYGLFVASNGSTRIQRSRLECAGFTKYFKDVFVSEDAPAPKPNIEFFEYAFSRGNIAPESAIIIGDSLTADIAGGFCANIKTLWYNPHGGAPESVLPDFEVRSLREIQSIL